MTQEIIATAIVLLTLLYVLWRLYKNFFSKKRNKNKLCNSCPSAVNCQIKDLKTDMEKKKEGCPTNLQ